MGRSVGQQPTQTIVLDKLASTPASSPENVLEATGSHTYALFRYPGGLPLQSTHEVRRPNES